MSLKQEAMEQWRVEQEQREEHMRKAEAESERSLRAEARERADELEARVAAIVGHPVRATITKVTGETGDYHHRIEVEEDGIKFQFEGVYEGGRRAVIVHSVEVQGEWVTPRGERLFGGKVGSLADVGRILAALDSPARPTPESR